MFVQVFHGAVTEPNEVRRALDDWITRLAPGAEGWLGSTTGVTADGTFFGMARFASAEAAQRNSERAEQGEWWSATSKLFSGEVTFHDCSEVVEVRGGGADEAGFVQVMQSTVTDAPRLMEIGDVFEQRFPDFRPDLLGFVVAIHDGEDGAFSQVAYFSSEADARAAESEEPPADVAKLLGEEMALIQDPVYVDLSEPWLHSPR